MFILNRIFGLKNVMSYLITCRSQATNNLYRIYKRGGILKEVSVLLGK